MRFLIVSLFGKILLNLPQVQQLRTLLVHAGQAGLQLLAVDLEFVSVLFIHIQDLLLVFLLSLLELLVPVFVKLLVLLNVRLLALLALLLVHEDHFFHLAGVLLLLQLSNPVFGHLSLNVTPI